jgi:hypothetical protein
VVVSSLASPLLVHHVRELGEFADAVAIVDIVAEMDDTFARRPGRDVVRVDRHRRLQVHFIVVAGSDRRFDLLLAPVRRVAQQPDHDLADVLDAHAARRMEALVVAEQVPERRVMHIDVVRVREIDLDRRHGVDLARILAEREFGGVVRGPVDRRRIDLLAFVVEDTDVLVREVVRILLHVRDQVLADDRDRNMPIGIEDDLVDLRRQHGRLARDLADDGIVALDDAAAFDDFHLGRRNIDEDVAVAEEARHRADADEVRLQLLQAGLGRDVHDVEHRLVDDAGRQQPVPDLEAADGGVDIAVENVGETDLLLRQIAGNGQPLAQVDDGLEPAADLEAVAVIDLGPAATADDVLHRGQRRFDIGCRVGREERVIGLDLLDRRRGAVVEFVVPLLVLLRLHQLVERVVAGGHRRNDLSRKRGGRTHEYGTSGQGLAANRPKCIPIRHVQSLHFAAHRRPRDLVKSRDGYHDHHLSSNAKRAWEARATRPNR